MELFILFMIWFAIFIIALTIVNELFQLGLDKLIAWLMIVWVVLALITIFTMGTAFAAAFSIVVGEAVSVVALQLILWGAAALFLGSAFFFYPDEAEDVFESIGDGLNEVADTIIDVVKDVAKDVFGGLGPVILALGGGYLLVKSSESDDKPGPKELQTIPIPSESTTKERSSILDRIRNRKALA